MYLAGLRRCRLTRIAGTCFCLLVDLSGPWSGVRHQMVLLPLSTLLWPVIEEWTTCTMYTKLAVNPDLSSCGTVAVWSTTAGTHEMDCGILQIQFHCMPVHNSSLSSVLSFVPPLPSLQTRCQAGPGLWVGPGQRFHLAPEVVSCWSLGASQLCQKGVVFLKYAVHVLACRSQYVILKM